jgi:hypothetical protein
MWGRHLLRELGFEQRLATIALTDNEGVEKQSTKAINHTGAKHYRIAQAMIRQLNEDKIIETEYVNTDHNCADLLTKPLLTSSFERHRRTIMGPQSLEA